MQLLKRLWLVTSEFLKQNSSSEKVNIVACYTYPPLSPLSLVSPSISSFDLVN